jgi:hypothetical protein
MKLANKILVGVVVTSFLVAFGWFVLGERKLSYTDTAYFKVDPLTNANAIRISGLVMHSAFAVKDIRFSAKGDTIDIDLILAFGKNAPSGSFDFVVFLMPQTKKVRIGADRVIIWNKGVSP